MCCTVGIWSIQIRPLLQGEPSSCPTAAPDIHFLRAQHCANLASAVSPPDVTFKKKKNPKTLNGSGVLFEVVHTRLVVAYILILQIGSCLGTGPQTLQLERWHCLQDNFRLKYCYSQDCWLFCSFLDRHRTSSNSRWTDLSQGGICLTAGSVLFLFLLFWFLLLPLLF